METEINGQQYRTGKLNAIQQFHVARRLAPALWAMGAAAAGAELTDLSDAGALMKLGPVAEALAKMSDADTEYILKTCMSVVARQQGQGWAAVQAQNGSALMFEDIDLPVMMRLTFVVVQENLGNFFPEPAKPA